MFVCWILCIRKRKISSSLQYVYLLDFVYQKEGHFIIPTICLWSRLCVSEKGKLYHTYSMFMIEIVCIRKRKTVLCIDYVCDLESVYQKERKCIIPTSCLSSRSCVSERRKLCHAYNMCMIKTSCSRKRETTS